MVGVLSDDPGAAVSSRAESFISSASMPVEKNNQ